MRKTIAVLFGGRSPEYSVSLQSAAAVMAHVDPEKYDLVRVGITRAGEWLRFYGAPEDIPADRWQQDAACAPLTLCPSRERAGLWEQKGDLWCHLPLDAAFPVMHGAFGEDGTLQGLLELAGIPIVGCGTLASALCMDKDKAHRLVGAAGIPVPASAAFGPGAVDGEIAEAARALGWPVFVKPVAAGSSFGISRVEDEKNLPAAVASARAHCAHILLEAAVPGFELGCAVMGSADGELTVGELDEVELQGGFFDFTEKYSLVNSKLIVPARVPAEKAAEAKRNAVAIYRVLGCGGFARVDQFLRPDGVLVFSEVNTIPGFTTHSRYPNMMKAVGIGFDQLVDRLIGTAVSA
ncbi:D-alanine--D-alanine ligase [Ruminococcaceae bacterium OttesenSCG-928-D13]|nr:D-alanine--D-alanine ligase [Ruminococcaceae bacterium OttesenSCG-928-D13]